MKRIVILSLSAIFLILAGVYAGYNVRTTVNETSGTTSSWNVSITNVTTKTLSGSAVNNSAPTFSALTATFNTGFTKYNDYAEYSVTVKNNGNVAAKLNSISVNNPSDSVVVTYSGISQGETLAVGASKTFTVKLRYDHGIASATATISLSYTQV